MGKKGSWFSAIKRVFTHNSKNKPTVGSSDKKGIKEKKKGRPEKTKSLIPLFREPSSIEKILGEADQLLIRPTTPNIATNTTTTNNIIVPNTAITGESSSSPPVLPARQVSVRGLSPKATSPPPLPPLKASTSGVSCSSSSSSKASATKAKTEKRKEIRNVQRVEPTSRDLNLSATKIQAAFRGYVARRSLRALRGLVRLQEVVRGQNVKRQTANAMKQLQLLVRVQTQIQSRRIQTLENRSQDYGNHNKSENEDWDHSLLTKEEVESRLQKKVEAVIRRERAMAYAYSRQMQLWKENPKPTYSPLDTRSNGQPWWWNWLDRQLPESHPTQSRPTPRNIPQTPPPRGPSLERKPSPLHPHMNFTPDHRQSLTPRSSRSAAMGPTMARRSFPIKDDDSLMSCPPFSVPRYMSPTVSAMAKARRASGSPGERFMGTPDSRSSRRFSFPLTPKANGVLGWDTAGPAGDSGSRSELCKNDLAGSVTGFGMGSPVSVTVVAGRKPFNRFV